MLDFKTFYSLCGATQVDGSVDLAVDFLIEHVDDALIEERFDDINQFLHDVNLDFLDTNLVVAALSITLSAHPCLPERRTFVERCRARLTVLAPDRVERLMAGLKGVTDDCR